MPASAMASQSSASPSRRRRKSALARCSASTASNSFFLSARRASCAALGGGCACGCDNGADDVEGRITLDWTGGAVGMLRYGCCYWDGAEWVAMRMLATVNEVDLEN